jgi:hypothetical protein
MGKQLPQAELLDHLQHLHLPDQESKASSRNTAATSPLKKHDVSMQYYRQFVQRFPRLHDLHTLWELPINGHQAAIPGYCSANHVGSLPEL